MRSSIRTPLALLVFWLLGSSGGGLAEGVYRSDGRIRPAGAGLAAGGDFHLESRIAPRRAPQGEGYVLVPGASAHRETGAGGACACFNLIFADDFETGSTGEWDLP